MFLSVGREGIEPTLLIESDCFTDSLDSQVQSTHWFSSGAGGIRTHKHSFLRQAAQPLAYHTERSLKREVRSVKFQTSHFTIHTSKVVLDGLEPSIDWV